jgi:hypothetical protein
MALPTSRERTYAAGSQVFSADLNKIQDCIIGRKRPVWSVTWNPTMLVQTNFAWGANPVNAAFPPCLTSNSVGALLTFGIPYEDGDRLIGFKYMSAGNGAADTNGGRIDYAATIGTATSQLASWTDTNRAAVWGVVDVTTIAAAPAFTSQVLAATGSLIVTIPANGTGLSLGGFTALFDRL